MYEIYMLTAETHINIYFYMSYNMPYTDNPITLFPILVLQPVVLEQ
jgi:hypothetical protein